MIITLIMLNSFQTLTLGTTAPSPHSDCDNPFVSSLIFYESNNIR